MMRILTIVVAVLFVPCLILMSALTAGCGENCSLVDCAACPPPLTMTFVDDTTGAPLSGVTIDHPSGHCADSNGRTVCSVDEFGAGTFHFVAGATGYQGLNVEETIPAEEIDGCCGCGYTARDVELRLIPR